LWSWRLLKDYLMLKQRRFLRMSRERLESSFKRFLELMNSAPSISRSFTPLFNQTPSSSVLPPETPTNLEPPKIFFPLRKSQINKSKTWEAKSKKKTNSSASNVSTTL
jgi:hypothetical protein